MAPQAVITTSRAQTAPVVLDAAAIRTLPWQTLGDLGDVQVKALLSSGDCVAGLLRLAAGAKEKAHVHVDAHHHGWVLSGSAEVAGVHVSAGTYFHIPAGVEHAISGAGPEGCEVFYVYQPSR